MELIITLVWVLLVLITLIVHPEFKVMFRKGYRQSYLNYILTVFISTVIVLLSPILFLYGAFKETIRGEAT